MTVTHVNIIGRPAIHHCEREWTWRPAPFRDFDIWIVFAGKGWLEIRGEKHLLGSGSSLIFQPGDAPRCSHDPDNPLVVFSCHFYPGEKKKRLSRFQRNLIHVRVVEFDLLHRSAQWAARVFDDGMAGRQLATALLRQMIIQIDYLIERRPSPKPDHHRLAELALDIRSRPGTSWTVPAMAGKCGLSVPHFNRMFRRTFACSPMQYVIRYRVLRAIALLRESDMSIQQIADSVGYQDVFFFYRQFRRLACTTPRLIRLGEKSCLDSE